MKTIFLGMDVGTTNTKVLAIDESGTHVATTSNETNWHNKPGARVEAIAEEIFAICLKTTFEVIEEVKKIVGPIQVSGIGITGMAESGVIVDKRGLVLTNPVAWFDGRGEQEMVALGEEFKVQYQSKTGLVFKPESSLSTLLSFKTEGFDFTKLDIVWLNLLEYIAFRLTGTMASEPSLSSRTALYDQSTHSIWKSAQEILGFSDSFIPDSRLAGESWGAINSLDFQSELQGAKVTVAGHDHPVGALGSGATGENQIFNSTGTADVIYRSIPGELTDSQRLDLANMGVASGRNVLPGITSCIGGSRGGLVLRRALDLVGGRYGERRDELDGAWKPNIKFKDVIDLTQSKSISNDISILVTGDAGPIELWAAALDYVSQENRKFLLGLEKVVGPHKTAVAAGGWIKMRSVREIKASVISNLQFSDVKEAGAIGAAYMGSWAGQQLGDSLLKHIEARTAQLIQQA